jgi:FKBP-type peptidyl-prolyl cis-trans isomerase FkpA
MEGDTMTRPFIPGVPKFTSRVLAVIVLTASCVPAFAGETPAQIESQQTLYAVGVSVARSLNVFNLTQAEFETVKQGLVDARAGLRDDFNLTPYNAKIQALAKSRRAAAGLQLGSAGRDFLEKAAKENGALKTDSGMVYLPVAVGKGDPPKASDSVKVHYRGTLVDGREFDSSYKRSKPLEFRLNNVIKCWIEGLQKMRPGGKARLVCPPELAYGENGAGEMILPGATLAFEVELLEVIPAMSLPASAGPAAGGVPTGK